jgi:hypothetical protein
MPLRQILFGEGGCVAPAVRSGTGRHTFRRRPNGVVSIFSRRFCFFELARSIFTRSGGTFSSKHFFVLFAPCRMHDLRALWCEKRIQMLKRGKRSFLFA